MDSTQFIFEEVDGFDSESENSSDDESETRGLLDSGGSRDSDICVRNGISQEKADLLYREAGSEVSGDHPSGRMVILPKPSVMLSCDEKYILEAKETLQIHFELEDFQVQALLGKGHNS